MHFYLDFRPPVESPVVVGSETFREEFAFTGTKPWFKNKCTSSKRDSIYTWLEQGAQIESKVAPLRRVPSPYRLEGPIAREEG